MRHSIRTLLPILLALAPMAAASDDKTDQATLRGVKSVCVVVEVTGAAQDGSSITKPSLQSEVEGRLLAAGIAVDKDATTCLYLNVRPLSAMGKNGKPIGLYALDVSLQFMQMTALSRDPSLKSYSPTWSVAHMATVPIEDLGHMARKLTVDLSDRFVNAFRSVNPK